MTEIPASDDAGVGVAAPRWWRVVRPSTRRTARAPAAGANAGPQEQASHSHLQILKSTAVIGASSLVNVGFSILRNKALALILGPEGIGLFGLFGSIVDLTQTVASLGLQSSGVRQMAEASGSGDAARVARISRTLTILSWILGSLGAVGLFLASPWVTQLTFGNESLHWQVATLSLAIVFQLVAASQMAQIQGLRQIRSLAAVTMLSGFLATLIGVPLVLVLGTAGVAPATVIIAACSVITAWYFARQMKIPKVSLSLRDIWAEASDLLKLGVIFMTSAMLTVGAAYAIRLIVLRSDGILAAGLYQSAWSLGGLYVGFILQTMGADFYPRLTAIAGDNAACNRLVNEQAQISMLLAGPGILATLTLAPIVVHLFYSAQFAPAADMLRWICLGMMLRVVAWPMGYIVLAKGARKVFFWTEVAATVVHVGLAWMLVSIWGANSAAAAFFGLYVWHSILIYVVVSRLSGFRWSRENLWLGSAYVPTAILVFGASQVFSFWVALALGLLATSALGLHALWTLARLVPIERLPSVLRPALRWFSA